FAFEEYSKHEKNRLEELVAQRTDELNKALQLKDTLFKVVLHDIANPIQGLLWILRVLKDEKLLPDQPISKLLRLTGLVKDVIHQVRSMESLKTGQLQVDISPVSLEDCLKDLTLVFEGQLKHKEIELIIENHLPAGTSFLAEQNSFTTSVLCNLVSN